MTVKTKMKNPTTAAAVVYEERRRVSRRRTPALSLAMSRRLRHEQAGQSLIVAIIVLFLLLFLGGIFIALIANNLRNTRRGIQVSAADKYAEAGIRYLDQQLMTSADGADWRPAPPTTLPNPNDPDYFWIKPFDPATGEGGYVRITFGGPNGGGGTQGGRALVRISYRPYHVTAPTGGLTTLWDDKNGNFQRDAGEDVNPASADQTRKYLKLDSIGRVGVIVTNDPTTYRNTEGLGLRREMMAYKSIGITDYLRFITNKDRKPDPNVLGANILVQDRPAAQAGTTAADGTTDITGDPAAALPYGGISTDPDAADDEIVNRPIVSTYQGPIRVNGDLTFYGLNYFALDSRLAEAVLVSGNISMGGVPGNTAPAALQTNDPTKVFITDTATNAPTAAQGVKAFAGLDTGNPIFAGVVVPSASTSFTTLNGMVRDNPRSNNTQGLEATTQDVANVNLRAVPRLEPPIIDAPIGDRGLTRYRLLTRDAPPMAATDLGPNAANQIGLGQNAGAYGWGQGLYIANTREALSSTNVNVQGGSVLASQRAEWLNPNSPNVTGGKWEAGQYYVPKGVTITLTPRYMIIEPSDPTLRYMRRPTDGQPIGKSREVRYTYSTGSSTGGGTLANPPVVTLSSTDPAVGADVAKFAGYPATPVPINGAQVMQSDFVVFAEGNVRIRGVAGGVDPETLNTFVRHLTVVSNGTIYVEGNLLRDNIPSDTSVLPPAAQAAATAARGRSSIALLAKDYVAVNTTRFLDPDVIGSSRTSSESGNAADISQPGTVTLNPAAVVGGGNDTFGIRPSLGPINNYNLAGLPDLTAGNLDNLLPPYANPADAANYVQQIFFRHGKVSPDSTSMSLSINSQIDPVTGAGTNYYLFPPSNLDYYAISEQVSPLFRDDRFALNPARNFFFPVTSGPYGPPALPAPVVPVPSLGLPNQVAVAYDNSSGNGKVPYQLTRVGIVPSDIRIEALMYAQEGSFFIIPGPWFNPDPNDTYERYITQNSGSFERRNGESQPPASNAPINPAPRIDPWFPFYKQPQDIRITFFGAISENRSAEVGDQSAWLEKWGWVPRFYGSTGLPRLTNEYPQQDTQTWDTIHGPGNTNFGQTGNTGTGIQYVYDGRGVAPYGLLDNRPLRPNPYVPSDPLPLAPRLPVAPGLLYFGEVPVQ